MEITRDDLKMFLHTLRQAHLRVGAVTPTFLEVLAALDEAANTDGVSALLFEEAMVPEPPPLAPTPVLTDDEIPF